MKMPFYVDTPEQIRARGAEREAVREAMRQRASARKSLNSARRYYNVDLMIRCKRCMAEFERYIHHGGYCQDCH
jgi:hypothetical protein